MPLRDVKDLGRIRVNVSAIEDLLADSPSRDVYAVAPLDGDRWQVRMFAPTDGIAEDPATGSAAAAFAGYLAQRESASQGGFSWTLSQGSEIGRPSTLEIEADKRDGEITAIRVGGQAVMVSEGVLSLPD